MTGEEITTTSDYLAMATYLTQVYDSFRCEIPHIKHPKLVSPLTTQNIKDSSNLPLDVTPLTRPRFIRCVPCLPLKPHPPPIDFKSSSRCVTFDTIPEEITISSDKSFSERSQLLDESVPNSRCDDPTTSMVNVTAEKQKTSNKVVDVKFVNARESESIKR